MIEDKMSIKGKFYIKHIRNGKVIDERYVHNLITSAGKALVAGLIVVDVGGTAFDYIAIGTGTTAAAAGDTALETEITTNGGERRGGANVTGSRVTTTVANDTSQWSTTFTFTGSFAVTEAGVLNDPSAGTLLCHQVFAAINVISGDSLQIVWKVAFS